MVNPPPARPYDLAVAYRIYPGVSRTPLFAGRDKLDLARVALESFRAGLGGLRAKIWVLLDNCPPSYRELFLSLFDAQDLELLPLDGEGNWRTFRRQIDLLAAQEAAEVVYFAEDDYLYLPDSLARLVEFLRAHADADFLTAYDHPDLYRLRLHRHPARTRDQGATRWRTLRYVVFPLIKSGMVAGAVFAFIHSFTDVNLSVFLARPGELPITVKILGFLEFGFAPTLAAVSVITLILPLVLVVIVERVSGLGDFIYGDRERV